ncbi:MAG: hypothetical protein A2V88_08980 [Elusimicrobia bacterium RBG_16_66_12]|nr:MAG: hypothetical protein A2V88_08980 [Elusimicrobia bacterium RBG_16_66_12]
MFLSLALLASAVTAPPLRAADMSTDLSGAYENARGALAAASLPKDKNMPHPLLGRIWDAAAKKFIDEGELMRRLGKARFILLGEIHDNSDHHALQARIVRGLAAAGARCSVSFEMLPVDIGPRISARALGRPVSLQDLEGAWRDANEGDTYFSWSAYRPVVEAAVESGFGVLPANPAKADTRLLHEKGWSALNADFVARYLLDRPLPESVLAEKRREVVAGHCGYDPGEAYANAAINVQRARDASMAESLASSERGVLIAGVGHTRSDSGVPAYLALRFPEEKTISIAFTELASGFEDPATYVREPQDYVWFTLPWKRQDPCVEFRKQLERMKKRS